VTSLERDLHALAATLEWPAEPDLAARVLARASEAKPEPRRAPRRLLAIAVAAVLAGTLAVLAVPPARTAVFDWLGIGGARIVEVDELPAVAPSPGLDLLGDSVTLERARALAGFDFSEPPAGERDPDEILVSPGLRVSYLWRDGNSVRLLVTQFPGSANDPGLVKKLVGSGTTVEELRVESDPALWLEGGPHVVFFVAPDGMVQSDQGWLAGNTLLVDRDGVTVRVEGLLERDEAVELAEAMSP
jgi:hypothetical protein